MRRNYSILNYGGNNDIISLKPSDAINDEDTIKVERHIIEKSKTIKNLIEDATDISASIPLPNVDKSTLTKIIDYINKKIIKKESIDNELSAMSDEDLLKFVLAVNYLDIPELLDSSLVIVYRRLVKLYGDKIRAIYNKYYENKIKKMQGTNILDEDLKVQNINILNKYLKVLLGQYKKEKPDVNQLLLSELPLELHMYIADNINKTIIIAIVCGYHNLILDRYGNVYTFFGGRPGELDNPSNRLRRLEGVDNIISIACGGSHCLALDRSGDVYSWSDNRSDQLGPREVSHTDNTKNYIPTRIAGLKNIISIAAGRAHNIVVDKDGNVFTWGMFQWGGPIKIPMRIIELKNIISVVCGNNDMALDKDGNVYSLHSNKDKDIGFLDKPKQIDNLKDIVSIAGYESLNMALDKYGHVYTWGGNNDYGELGHGNSNRHIGVHDPENDKPRKIINLNNIKSIACGPNHCLALNTDGDVFSWGIDDYGELGQGKKAKVRTWYDEYHNPNVHTPTKIDSLSNIILIAASKYKSMAVDVRSRIFVWGNNAGYLHKDKKYFYTPTQIPDFISEIVQQGGSSYHKMKYLKYKSKYLNLKKKKHTLVK